MTSLDSTNDVSHGEAAIPGEVRRWRAFSLLAVAFFMMIVDLTIVNVALPTIGGKLHFPEPDLQWVVTAYALTFGGFLLLGGRAADLLGRLLQLHFHRHPVHAAGAGLLRPEDRLRLAGDIGHRDRARRAAQMLATR